MHTGVFRNKEERTQNYPLLIEKEGISLAFLNYTYGTNGFVASPPLCVNYIDKEQIKKDIQRAKDLHADLIIATVHWGVEYKLKPNKEQENLANFMKNEGVALIIGAHPHVVQPSTAIVDSAGQIAHVVVYSLGNFVSGMVAPNTEGGQIVKITLEKRDNKVCIQSAEYALIYRHKTKIGGKTDYAVIPVGWAEKTASGEATVELDAASYLKMQRFAQNARAVLDAGNQPLPEYRLLTSE
jgi:poly-gamma-glutamate synthesis protein (capsule biosynthesis protein)